MPNFIGNHTAGSHGKISKKKREAYCEAIRLGLTKTRAIRLIGVSMQTIDNWCRWGERDGKGKYFHFWKSVIKAQELFIEDNLLNIQAVAQGKNQIKETKTTYDKDGKIKEEIVTVKDNKPQWTASAWLLERRHPQDWSQHQIIEDKTADNMANSLDEILNK